METIIQKKNYYQDANNQWWHEWGKHEDGGALRRTKAIIVKCLNCKKPYPIRKVRLKFYDRNFCSRKCSGLYNAGNASRKSSGKKHYNWKKGRIKSRGYIFIYAPDHPHKTARRYIAEHRLVMEKHLGRYLFSHEKIHHINAVKDDNRLENLEIISGHAHLGRIDCPYCGKYFKIK